MIKQIVIGLLVAVLIAWVLIGLANAQEAYVMPVERWSPHVSQHGYKAPRHIRRLKREARREKRARIWAPPVRYVAKVHRFERPPVHFARCAHPVSAVGTEHYSEDDAKAALQGGMAPAVTAAAGAVTALAGINGYVAKQASAQPTPDQTQALITKLAGEFAALERVKQQAGK